MIEFKQHQTKIVNYFKEKDPRGVILYHGLGSGKTITSIGIAELYNKNVVCIVPASMRTQWKNELNKMNVKNTYKIYSFEEVSNKLTGNIASIKRTKKKKVSKKSIQKTKEMLDNKVVIIDEAHRLRNIGVISRHIINITKNVHKILLLTGTPIVNRPSDLVSLVNIVSRTKVFPLDKQEFADTYVDKTMRVVKTPVKLFGKTLYEKSTWTTEPTIKNTNLFRSKIRGLFSFYENIDVSKYPTTKKYEKSVIMDKLQQTLHTKIEEQTLTKKELKMLSNNYALDVGNSEAKGTASRVNAYLSKTRQLSNVVDSKPSEKVKQILSHVLSAKKPVVVYSNYISNGVAMFGKLLEENNQKLTYRLFTGSTTKKEKASIVKDYNSGKCDVLLISRSGSEGLDLKNTREIHIMEPHWNSSQLDQVIGRGVRYMSHNALPVEERHVDIYYWYSVYPKGLFDTKISSDKYLLNMSKSKKKLANEFKKVIKEESVINKFN